MGLLAHVFGWSEREIRNLPLDRAMKWLEQAEKILEAKAKALE